MDEVQLDMYLNLVELYMYDCVINSAYSSTKLFYFQLSLPNPARIIDSFSHKSNNTCKAK